jgi:hypothetical protein
MKHSIVFQEIPKPSSELKNQKKSNRCFGEVEKDLARKIHHITLKKLIGTDCQNPSTKSIPLKKSG